MSNDKLKSEANPSLVVLRDNKPKWYLPETRREGYRNLHKINRYGLLYRSDLVLKLNLKKNKNIEIKTNSNLTKLKDKNVKLGIRSEFINVVEKEGENTIKASLTRVEDFGNFKLLTANMDNFVIKSKVDRELPISIGDINLYIPPEKCCVYENEKLI